jgi:Serine protease inhibitor
MPVNESYTAVSTQQLGFALLRPIFSPDKNACISPISISLAIQLALYGARGNTAMEILRTLGINAPNREALADDAERLIQHLLQEPKNLPFEGPGALLRLAVVNSLWTQLGVQLNSEFSAAMQAKYLAGCGSLDFSDPRSLDQINSWVAQITENKIPTVINQLHPNNMVVLINCAYFKARWNHIFKPELTEDKPFYLSGNSPITIPTMQLQCTKRYFQDERVQILQMHYTDKRFGMYVILPARGISLHTLVANLSPERWQWWLNQLKAHSGTLSFPKFKIESSFILNDYLKHLGMIEAFSAQADFSAMVTVRPPVFNLDFILHKTFLEVDEQGTEAAAATAVVTYGSAGNLRPMPPFEMVVDRPFVYIIYDSETGTILFLGTVNDPR